MKQNEFEIDLKNITIIFLVICFILLYFKGLQSEKLHQKNLDRVYGMVETSLEIIQEQDEDIKSLDEGLRSMNDYAEYLEERLNNVGELENIIKDLRRDWVRK